MKSWKATGAGQDHKDVVASQELESECNISGQLRAPRFDENTEVTPPFCDRTRAEGTYMGLPPRMPECHLQLVTAPAAVRLRFFCLHHKGLHVDLIVLEYRLESTYQKYATMKLKSLIALPLLAIALQTLAKAEDINSISAKEAVEGWTLLFNGRDLSGFHNFKKDTIKPGWQVVDGTLACVDPHNAGDLATAGEYDWFELTLEFKMGEGAKQRHHVSRLRH